MSLAIGVDVGGTKTAVLVGSVERSGTVPSTGWNVRRAADSTHWLAGLITRLAGAEPRGSVVVGAHGAETQAQCDALGVALAERLPSCRVRVVNDGHLLVPAAGHTSGIALVVGTGSVALGRDNAGFPVRCGGWGWVLDDTGSASALVRDAARTLLGQRDRGLLRGGEPLAVALLESIGVPDLDDLAARLSWDGGVEHWGDHAPAVFAAADAGSRLARGVCIAGAQSLAEQVLNVRNRGGEGTAVVIAGGVVTARPDYLALIRAALVAQASELRPELLTVPPVHGALRLAQLDLARTA